MDKNMSLFIALTFNDEVKNNICELIVRLRSSSLQGKFSSRANLQSTLVFIEDHADIDAIKAAMDDIKAEHFTLDLGGYGILKKRTGNVHWAGIRHSDNLDALREELFEAFKAHGVPCDTEAEFKPYLILGRDVVTAQTFNPATFLRSVPKQQQEVVDITLMQSGYDAEGKQAYTPLYVKTLA
jgi:2'-5' RNA ligase